MASDFKLSLPPGWREYYGDKIEVKIMPKIPECSCGGEVVENTAMGKPFFVCRGCKKEVGLKSKAPNSAIAARMAGEVDAAPEDYDIDHLVDLFFGHNHD